MIETEQFIPFFGVVEDINDPMKLGRVRVRAYGYHTQNVGKLPTEKLPWFSSVVSNSAGINGDGHSPTGYALASTVFGYFLDSSYQIGMVVGTLVGMTNGTSDVSALATQNPNHRLYQLRKDNRVENVQDANPGEEWSEPEYKNKSKYPDNTVYESRGGLIREMDGTPNEERINEYHPSGTYYEVRPDGTKVDKIVKDHYSIVAGDDYININGDVKLTVNGNMNTFIKGDWKIQVSGDKQEVIQGDVKEYYGSQRTQLQENQETHGRKISEYSDQHNVNAGPPDFQHVEVTVPKDVDMSFRRATSDQSKYAQYDEVTTTPYAPDYDYPQTPVVPDEDDKTIKSNEVPDKKPTPKLSDCMEIQLPVDYNIQLSDNFTIRNFTTGVVYPHRLRAQHGLSVQQIVCNLQALAQEIAQPIYDKFGPFRINSGFRPTDHNSQHELGCAFDLQEPTWSHRKHLEVAEWVAKNLSYHGIILEHSDKTKNVWVHFAFNRLENPQAGKLLTMLHGHYQQGLTLYFG